MSMSASGRRALALAAVLASPLPGVAAGPVSTPDVAAAPARDVAAPAADAVPAAASTPAADTGATPAGTAPPPAPASAPAPAPQRIEVRGVRQRLDAARNGLSPDTGSSIYRLDRQDIGNLPLGESTPLNQVILQTPGVVQDSYGQLHVRGDHANVQYRINGVIIPESISGFGQALETRFADHLSVLTGALPAQYGLRNAAVVEIQSKGETADSGGSAGIVAGSHDHAEATAELSGSRGAYGWYLTGSVLRDALGIENPTPGRKALHDRTQQDKGFGMLSRLLGDDSRVSVLFGSTANRFQIPDLPGQTPAYPLDGAAPADSATLDARQRETNRYAVLSYQGAIGDRADYQVSVFDRSTDVHYRPDAAGDLEFYGIAADILRRNVAHGVQADLSWRTGPRHTLRTGLYAQRERYDARDHAAVFPADAAGNPTSGVPVSIQDDTRIDGRLWSAYLQDEWQPVRRLTVNYGLRYDQVRSVSDESQLSPRIGVVYDLAKDLRLHAGYARYFTPPPTEKIDTTSVQKFLGTTNALPSDADTAVRSERSDYDDVGVAWQPTPHVTVGADAYWRKVRHLQDEGQFGNALIYSAFNYGQGRIRGLDLSATYRDRALAGYLNIGLTSAMGKGIETGQFNFGPDELGYIATHWVHLDHEQRVSASAGASYRGPGGLAFSADALLGSGLRNGFANTGHLPGYATVNLALAGTLEPGAGVGKVEARVSLLNVADRIYELRDGTGIGVGAPQYGQRRTLMLGLSKPF